MDQYTGGVEHAVMHLLYARFFVKAMRDLGLLDFDEPFVRLVNQGTIVFNSQKMSKSRGNVIAPDDYVGDVGADVVRTYLMFMGPWEQGGDWNDNGINGMARWTNRVWELCQRDADKLGGGTTDEIAVGNLRRALHKTIRKVSEDMERFKFNTGIAAMMEFSNTLNQSWQAGNVDAGVWRESIRGLVLMMAPITPFLAEELWSQVGGPFSVHQQPWPEWDEDLAADEMITLVVQVNGKLRDRIEVPSDVSEEDARSVALASDRVKQFTDGEDGPAGDLCAGAVGECGGGLVGSTLPSDPFFRTLLVSGAYSIASLSPAVRRGEFGLTKA